ncbi:MAG: hypothetical protein KDD50_07815 [Bdellovibrionales bacterium]|nr:hypothetical protein [Bdellovibrionales bacterium]
MMRLFFTILLFFPYGQAQTNNQKYNLDDPRVGQQHRKNQMNALSDLMKQMQNQNIDMDQLQKQIEKAQQELQQAGTTATAQPTQPQNTQPYARQNPNPQNHHQNPPKNDWERFQQQNRNPVDQQNALHPPQHSPSPANRGTVQQQNGNSLLQLGQGDQNGFFDGDTVLNLLKPQLSPRLFKVLSVVSDKRVTQPLQEINFSGKKLRLMLLLELALLFVLMFIRFAFRKAASTFTKTVVFNLAHIVVFWIFFVGLIPTLVYGSPYARLLKGLYFSIKDII